MLFSLFNHPFKVEDAKFLNVKALSMCSMAFISYHGLSPHSDAYFPTLGDILYTIKG